MVFDQTPNVPPVKQSGFKVWYKKFSSQPHQPFFTSGIIFFILFLSMFTSVYSGIINVDASVLTYHAYSMIFVVFIQFFLGFLFVVFPRFLMQAEIQPKVYMQQFQLYLLSSLGVLLSLFFFSEITVVFQLIMFVAQVLSFKLLFEIHKKSLMKVKEDTKWVLIGFASGLVAHLLFIISSFDFNYSFLINKLALNAGFYLFLFMIIFAISQRMIPFFTTAKAPGYVVNKTKDILLYVYVLLAIKVLVLAFLDTAFNLLVDIPLFILITRELIKWKLPFFKVPAIMWVLYLALYWIPVAFLLSIVESIMAIYSPEILFEKVVVHTIALGYFVTVLLGFGTRVVLGHSGSTPHANNFAITIFVAVQFIVLLRIISSFALNSDNMYLTLINTTAILLIVGLIVWSTKYLTILFKGK